MRKIINTALLVLSFLLAAPTSAQVTDDQDLNAFYRHVNRLYFHGRLKGACVHLVNGLLRDYQAEARVHESDAPCNYIIEVDDLLEPLGNDAKMDVYHEMCHIANWKKHVVQDHGPRWENCMIKLAQAGAFRGIW